MFDIRSITFPSSFYRFFRRTALRYAFLIKTLLLVPNVNSEVDNHTIFFSLTDVLLTRRPHHKTNFQCLSITTNKYSCFVNTKRIFIYSFNQNNMPLWGNLGIWFIQCWLLLRHSHITSTRWMKRVNTTLRKYWQYTTIPLYSCECVPFANTT